MEGTTKLRGGCHCGAVRYEVRGDPVHVALCHCADCRRASGAPMVAWAAFRSGDFACLAGQATTRKSSGASMRSFCADCGTGLWFVNEEALPGLVDVQSATLDDPGALVPQRIVARVPTGDGADPAFVIGQLDRMITYHQHGGRPRHAWIERAFPVTFGRGRGRIERLPATHRGRIQRVDDVRCIDSGIGASDELAHECLAVKDGRNDDLRELDQRLSQIAIRASQVPVLHRLKEGIAEG